MNRLEQKYGTSYKVKEVADFFELSSMAIYKWCHKGLIGIKVNGSWRIPEKDIEKLLERQELKEFRMPKGKKRNINNLINKSHSIT